MADELDTFVQKFRNLWNSGLDARLNMECHAGQAWVGLHLRLGHAPGPLHQSTIPKSSRNRDTPSRRRRRARRAVAREKEAVKATTEKVTKAEEAVQESPEIVGEDSETEEKVAKETSEQSLDEVNETIPQLDGGLEISNEPTYCRICKDCHEEIETAEDLSYHVMNNHETNDVISNYGRDWIEIRRYCIRRNSPFYNWFSTPFIT